MAEDIFEFWSRCPDDAKVHPDDKRVFNRANKAYRDDCLPLGYFGPLRTAKVVLLFLSPGYSPIDSDLAKRPKDQALYRSQRTGAASLPSASEWEGAHRWTVRILDQFGVEPEDVAAECAVMNIGAYKSKGFEDWHMLAALPSSRVALDHAQNVIFPAAELGQRAVVCLRSARYWGLGPNDESRRYGRGLFAPRVTKGGLIFVEDRQQPVAAVQRALGKNSG